MGRKCFYCNKIYIPHPSGLKWQKFCSIKCRNNYWQTPRTKLNLSTGTVGAISELVVSADLMKRGYEIYRALSPSSSCDILALKNKKFKSFEIRTGARNKLGSFTYSKNEIRAENIAVVIYSTNEIIYIPKID